jgi:MoaA/NifB/PqqE/SkfB family radical SAM enzyme
MLDKIKWLHVEPTTRCNAWCSSCPRNKNGFGLRDGLLLKDLSVDRLNSVIESCPLLERVIFCGVFGDPCASKIINEQLDLILKNKLYLQMSTNGSLRTIPWWENLANTFKKNIEVWFGIDGLEDTHSYYRQGTNFKKILDNAQAFIRQGGTAVWQFIPFEHNEHQIKACHELSQKMGFKEFRFIKNARYKEKNYNYKTGEEIQIKPWKLHNDTWIRKNNGYLNRIQNQEDKKTKIEFTDCDHLVFPSVFLNAYGNLTPCCHIHDTNLENFDIQKNFQDKKWLSNCLKTCGS